MLDQPAHESFPLRTVARLTGLTPDLIRAWEKRYGVVAPKRGPRGARLYTAADVDHLRLLRRVVAAGRTIGDVAQLSVAQLATLAAAPAADESDRRHSAQPITASIIGDMIDALQRFDEWALDRLLGDALMAFGAREFVRQIAKPLLDEVGEQWSDGRLSVADEHMLSALLRNLLTAVIRTRGQRSGATILLSTPMGERHELGLLLAGLMVADAGLRLCYLGTDLPSAELASAARRASAAVVGLAIVNGANQDTAIAEVRRLERELAPAVEVWLGGREAAALALQLRSTRAIVVDAVESVEQELARVRAQRSGLS